MYELIQRPPVLHNQASCADGEGKVDAKAEGSNEGTSHGTHGYEYKGQHSLVWPVVLSLCA